MPSLLPSDTVDVPPERVLLVIDMKGYSQMSEMSMAPTRAALDAILATSFTQCGIGDVSTLENAVKDRGDGAIFVLPARHAARLVDPFLDNLRQALERYERTRPAGASRLRLRASVHVGPLTAPAYRGDAVNDACRLVDSKQVYQAMAAATDHELPLAVVLSDPVFRRAVRAGRTATLQPRHFLRATACVDGKAEFEETCWLFVPGLVPTALSSYLAADDATALERREDGVLQRAATDAAREEREPSVSMRGRASGKARLIQVGRDYVEGRHQSEPLNPPE
ncbi:hypothetical protein ACFYMI_09170 [Streptomyces collinus]|uniref:hypothetical protein n=1 Tax=Streptomyces collinus TaxID=42684 RepID=UPI003696522F